MSDLPPAQPLPETVGLLFVAGCPRTGTTALQEYLNVHPGIMIGRERYKWIAPESVSREMFEAPALLAFDPSTEKYRTETRLMHMERIISAKDISQLSWVGDKYPGYLDHLDALNKTNPGCRFIVTHRDVTPVVNSYVARSKNPDDSWLGGRDVLDLAIRTWNRAVTQMRDALLSPELTLLPVPYDEFHQSTGEWIDRIGTFLEIDMPDGVAEEWERRSAAHTKRGGSASHLGPDEHRRIEEKADRQTEAELLRLIDRRLGRTPERAQRRFLGRLFGRQP